ncbi:LPS biosynthesis protein RfbU [Siminovitchia terrae]|uniref:glycosyltransferase family 4 protein n=1 Tax=Siminovitchia terrae TaxID=1914933 RepID=UPI001B228D26|nr:glycosyltransferase family 4 protein [Siminovitchia terrae]GIN90672.1 LPS biosynthesis protein RfbU [Siminovitchia terrae]
MKIWLISNMYPSKQAPNYGVFVKNTIENLEDSGHYIKKTVLYKNSNMFVKLFSYFKYYSAIILHGLLSEYDIIYVHYVAHNSFPLLFLKKIKPTIKIYTNVHGSDIVPEKLVHFKLQKYVKKLLEKSEKVIAPSNYFKGLIKQKYKLEDHQVYVYPSGGVNKEVFYAIDNKEEIFNKLNLDRSLKYIGYVGRLDYKKGWNVLLEALSFLNEEGFLIDKMAIFVGGGKEEEEFQKQVQLYKLDGKIIYYNMLSQEKLNEVYNCLDIFCFPTMREGESLGLVGLEAMAAGVPVIGSEIGGLLDYINHNKNGLLFEVGNSNDLREKLQDYFSFSFEKQTELKEACLKTAEIYEVKRVQEQLKYIFSNEV